VGMLTKKEFLRLYRSHSFFYDCRYDEVCIWLESEGQGMLTEYVLFSDPSCKLWDCTTVH
jgi:hypothetical protein